MTMALHSLSHGELRELVEQRDALLQQQLASHQHELEGKNASILQFAARVSDYETRVSDYVARVSDYEARVSDYETRVSDYAARVFDLEFQNKELRRLLFGARRERFVSEVPASQLMLTFEASTADVAAAVEAELEKITYERQKPQQKKHVGRMELPFRLSERTRADPLPGVTGPVQRVSADRRLSDLSPTQGTRRNVLPNSPLCKVLRYGIRL